MSSPAAATSRPGARSRPRRRRRDILAAAETLFRERGYAGTSMPQIAAEAGVVVETVYRAFGSKAGLFRAVVESVLAGGPTRADVPVEERPAIRAMIEEPDPRRQVALYAATQPGSTAAQAHSCGRCATRPGPTRSFGNCGTRWRRGDLTARDGWPGCWPSGALRRPVGRSSTGRRLDAVLTRGPRPARPRAWLVVRALRGLADRRPRPRAAPRRLGSRRPEFADHLPVAQLQHAVGKVDQGRIVGGHERGRALGPNDRSAP